MCVIINIHCAMSAKKKKGSDMMCAPGLIFEAGSCAKLEVIKEVVFAYNKSVDENDRIIMSSNEEILNPLKYKEYLVNEISKKLKDICTTQKCWSKQDFMRHMENKAREEFMKYTFRPDSPQGKWEWLNTFNINEAMAQYERKYKGFKFLGAVPMDFADLSTLEISNLDYDKLMNDGLTKLGVIFNLDNHNEPGSHWVALFSDLNNGLILFFDSFAQKPGERVQALMREQADYMHSIGKNRKTIRVDYNKVPHQKGNSECGVYSMRYLIQMAKGKDFDELCNNPISDKNINKCRNVYFDKYIHKNK